MLMIFVSCQVSTNAPQKFGVPGDDSRLQSEHAVPPPCCEYWSIMFVLNELIGFPSSLPSQCCYHNKIKIYEMGLGYDKLLEIALDKGNRAGCETCESSAVPWIYRVLINFCSKLYLLFGYSTTMKLYEPVCIVSDYLQYSTTENLVN